MATTFTPYGGSVQSLDSVQEEGIRIETGTIALPPPDDGTSTTANTVVVSLLAPIRQWKISGTKMDTIANLRTFCNVIVGASQSQERAHSFHSGFYNADYYVKITNFSLNYVAGEPGIVEYSLDFIECEAI